MKKLFVIALALVIGVALSTGMGLFETKAEAKTTFVTIGTGGITGVYYPTGGAIAKMLTDHDVDSVSAEFYDRQIKRGKVLVSVDTRETEKPREECLAILMDNGGSSADFS